MKNCYGKCDFLSSRSCTYREMLLLKTLGVEDWAWLLEFSNLILKSVLIRKLGIWFFSFRYMGYLFRKDMQWVAIFLGITYSLTVCTLRTSTSTSIPCPPILGPLPSTTRCYVVEVSTTFAKFSSFTKIGTWKSLVIAPHGTISNIHDQNLNVNFSKSWPCKSYIAFCWHPPMSQATTNLFNFSYNSPSFCYVWENIMVGLFEGGRLLFGLHQRDVEYQ